MMLQERKTTLDTSCFFYEQQTDFTSVTSLWRNGQRIRLLIWGLRVRVPPGMCFWYFVGGSPFFPLALYSTAPLFLVQGGVALLCLGCSRLKCGSCWRLRIKLAGKLFYLNKQQTKITNKQQQTNNKQTTNKQQQTTTNNNKQTTNNKQQTTHNTQQTTNTTNTHNKQHATISSRTCPTQKSEGLP